MSPYEGLGGPAPTLNKPGLTTPALMANFTVPASSNGPYWWQDGSGTTHIGGQCLGGAGTGLQQIWAGATLPAAAKPNLSGANGLFFPIAATDGTLATLQVATGGALWIVNTVAAKTWTLDGTSFLGGY